MKRAVLAPIDRMGEYRYDSILPLPTALFDAAVHLLWVPPLGAILEHVRDRV